MTNLEMDRAFELELSTAYDLEKKPSTFDKQYWLNQGLIKFVKTRYSGMNSKQKGFEQNQKRVEDLRNLIKDYQASNLTKVDNTYTIPYPQDCMLVLGENVYVHGSTADATTAVLSDVFECTIENITRRQTNRLTDVNYHNGYARPARVFEGNNVVLTTTPEYNISKYNMKYLKFPTKIDLFTNPTEIITDINDTTANEVVKLAVQMYIASLNDPRYQVVSNEINTME